VAREGGSLLHLGILPDVDLVLRVSVGADKFIQCLAEHQVADLGTHVHRFDSSSWESVSKFDGSVSSSSSWDQKPMLMRRPSHGFDCRQVIGIL
jgi:hypothetical protein